MDYRGFPTKEEFDTQIELFENQAEALKLRFKLVYFNQSGLAEAELTDDSFETICNHLGVDYDNAPDELPGVVRKVPKEFSIEVHNRNKAFLSGHVFVYYDRYGYATQTCDDDSFETICGIEGIDVNGRHAAMFIRGCIIKEPKDFDMESYNVEVAKCYQR